MRTFFDSSAWVKRYVEEEHSAKVMVLCKQASEIILNVITPIEILSGLNRLRRERAISKEQYLIRKSLVLKETSLVVTVGINSRIHEEAILLMEKSPLKASDAIQLASALICECDLLVSFDRQMQSAAKVAGLRTTSISQRR